MKNSQSSMQNAGKFEPQVVLSALQETGREFNTVFEQDNLLVEIYRPQDTDKQLPHDRDELYIIISGTGTFQLLQQSTEFKPGDLFFVPAYQEHRFTSFTNDFATWVIFTGPVKAKPK